MIGFRAGESHDHLAVFETPHASVEGPSCEFVVFPINDILI
jgi:hypothetical protein